MYNLISEVVWKSFHQIVVPPPLEGSYTVVISGPSVCDMRYMSVNNVLSCTCIARELVLVGRGRELIQLT